MQHTNSPKVQLILPSLIQSKTTEREDSHSESIVTLNTPTGYPSNEDTEPENESDHSQHSISSRSSMSSSPSDTVNTYRHHDFGSGDDTDDTSSSSDWEPSISLASTYLPRNNKKSNNKLDLETYNSLLATDHASQLKLKQLENINNILFYPYTNLQSVIFSNSYCYIESDYKKIKNVNLNETNDIDNDSITDMNWNDTQSVNKIKDLLRNLLVSASLTIGIREEEIYLMFTSPSPQEIIEQLRFGILSILCDVHIDRFGRRSYYRKNINYNDRSNKIKIHTSISTEDVHFYNHSHLPTNLFGINDINNLSSFLTESPTVTTQSTPMTPSTDYDSYPPLPDNNINNNINNNISPPVSDNNNLSPPIYPKRKINKQQLQKEKHKRNINKIHKSIKTIHMSEDKLDWKNIDYHQPVTYLLTKTKTTTYNNHNVKRTATDIGNKHMHNKLKNKKTNHKINKIKPISILSSLPEERAKNIKVKKRKSITTNKNKKNIKNRNKNKNKSKMKIKSKPNNKLINNKSPKQKANNK
eukprot:151362_1